MPELVLDTNVLVRYLTNDPPDMATRVADLLVAAEERRFELVVPPLVVAETVYVLGSVYRWRRLQIANGLLLLVTGSTLFFLDQSTIVDALVLYRDTTGLDFADAYVAALAISRGQGNVMSLDRKLRRLPRITVVSEPHELEGV